MDWIEIAPSALSSIAALAAAIAAFGSLKVSRESKLIAEKSALAAHHGSAATLLSETLKTTTKNLQPLNEQALGAWTIWPREIERYDHRPSGGKDPRPLRHVLVNASEMLERHGSAHRRGYKCTRGRIFSVISNGMGEISESEYNGFLRKADCSPDQFENIFGQPRLDRPITSASAFRWCYYQLIRRVEINDWRTTWNTAWITNGWLKKYCDAHQMVKPVVKSALDSLDSERKKLEHSVFPLEANPALLKKYDQAMSILEELLDFGDLDIIEHYTKDAHDSDLVPLVLYTMGVACLTNRAIETLEHDIQSS